MAIYDGTTVPQRFWKFVSRTEHGCWEWIGSRHKRGGYGQLSFKSKGFATVLKSHRVSWELHYGQIPDGLGVLHRCDNPPCVRPDHLFVGDQAVNAADMAAKGRAFGGKDRGDLYRGSKNANARLTEDQVAMVKRLLASGKTGRSVAAEFGVSVSIISAINTRKTWRHVA